MSADDLRLSTHAIRICQRPHISSSQPQDDGFDSLHDFFILRAQSDFLLEAAKFLGRHESRLGVQRKHKEDRDKQIGSFISSDNPFFPNTIIVNIPFEFDESFYDEESKLLTIEIEKASAYIIDGQHRLKAFKSSYSKGIHLPLVVAAYFGLQLPTIAEIFTRINFYQTPVNKSVVYDLLEFNKDPEFVKFRDAHKICEKLNSTIESPFYNLIKMLGIGSGLLSQAAFVEAITTRYKILPLLRSHLNLDEITIIISDYFNAIKQHQPKKWGNRDSILSRTVGFNALVKILMQLIQPKPNMVSEEYKFFEYAKVLASIDVDSEEIRSFGGFKGVNTLADMFAEALKLKGML